MRCRWQRREWRWNESRQTWLLFHDRASAIERTRTLGARLRTKCEFLQGFQIRLDAESGAFRQHEVAVLEADGNAGHAIAQCALRLHLLEDQEIGNGSGEMHGR